MQTFIDDFYSGNNNKGFYSYLSEFAKENNVNADLFQEQTARSSGAPGYVLSNSKDEYAKDKTPASLFKRTPLYFGFNYSSIQEGDIIIETNTPLDIGHAAIISYVTKPSSLSGVSTYVQTIEATPDYVYFGFLDDWRMIEYGVEIYRPNTTSPRLIQDAVEFCERHIGDSYELRPKMDTSDTKHAWYCSELLYAAYKNAGLNIGVRRNSDGSINYPTDAVLPADLAASYNLSRYNLNNYFLSLKVSSKSWSNWSIEITNNSYDFQTIDYNSKMCNYSDGQNWTNLSDLSRLYLNGHSSKIVTISENWFATTITASYTLTRDYITARIITYADNLNASSKSLSMRFNIIKYNLNHLSKISFYPLI